MPASIRVESGISAGTSYWIDRPVLRIGSDPQCEICLPSADLAAHAMTLEYRGGQYRAYNRGGEPIRVGRAVVAPGTHGTWEEDEQVLLPGDLRLVLNVDGDPQPCPRLDYGSNDDDTPESSSEKIDAAAIVPGGTPPKSSSKTMGQLAVIGVCMLLMAAFLTMGRGGATSQAPVASFDSIVKKLLEEGQPSEMLLRHLQYAEAALVRGQTNNARTRFLKLRDRLRAEAGAKSGKDPETRELVQRYAEYRIGQLQ